MTKKMLVCLAMVSLCLSGLASGQPPTSVPALEDRPPVGQPDWPLFRGCPRQTGVAASSLPTTLAPRWKHELGDTAATTAAIAGGLVYVGGDNGKLVALDIETGRLVWRIESEDENAIEAGPAVVAGLVVFGDEGGLLRACDARTGAPRWKSQTTDRIVSSVNSDDGRRLIFGSYDGHVYCLDAAEGSQVWRYDVGEPVHGTPAIADGHVLAAACDGNLHVISLSDGKLVRRVPLGSPTGASVAVAGRRAYLGMYGEEVLGIDWRAGKVLWRFTDQERSAPLLSSAAVTGEMVVIGGRDKRLRALDAHTGRQRWQFVTRGRVESSPVIVGERVFVGSADGNLYELDLKTGHERWRFEAGGGIYASPAVGQGCLVIGTDQGVVYCLGAKVAARGL